MTLLALVLATAIAPYIDPFIGTSGDGHTAPAAAYPMGFLQPGPDTGWNDWAHCSGYQFGDKELLGFSQTHLSGTGCPDLGDMRLVPMTGDARRKRYSLKMDKTSERAVPGYYAVRLEDEGLLVETTVAPKAAMYRITPDEDGIVHLLVDQEGRIGDFSDFRPVTMPEGFIRADGDRAFDAYFRRHGWVAERTVYSRFEFSHPFAVAFDLPCVDRKNGVVRRVFDFNLKKGEPLIVRLAFSTSLNSAARANLDRDLRGRTFDEVRTAASEAWEDVLSRVRIDGTDSQKKAFYTSAYHLFFQPNEISDYGEKPFYSTLSCWDTFRAAHPLYTILCPERVSDFVSSILEQGRRTGYLPIWTLWGIENQCMIGVHSIPILVDAYLKGFTGDWGEAWRQIVNTQTVHHPSRYKEDWKTYDAFGYFPYDLVPLEGVSRTFEVCFDDSCAAQLGKALGKPEAAFFERRAQNWKNLWRDDIGFPCGRDSKGAWRPNFDPAQLGHEVATKDRGCDFTEGNAWQYMWHVMQDPEGLIARLGGKEAFVKRLDGLFRTKVDPNAKKLSDVTGLIGQYAHGNEPSHHVAYFYQFAGRPDRTAEIVREVFDRFYGITPDGLCGNDDCGQMSAWYLFSAMGFYPFNPCGGEYIIGAPQVPKAVIQLPQNQTIKQSKQSNNFTVLAKNLSKENKYVKSVTLNGKPITDWKIRHEDIMKGGELVFEMCANGETYENPIIREDFPDPTFWSGDDGWVYGTATGLKTIRRSQNFVDWEDTQVPQIATEDVMSLKSFSKQFWAPDVIRRGNRYLLYVTQFVTSDTNRLICCESATPGGPFRFRSVVVESWKIGKRDCAIDSEVVPDKDGLWLFIGSVAGGIWRTRLTADGLALDSQCGFEHVAGLIPSSDDRPWIYSHRCYEGSYLYWRNGWWYLFVSCGAIDDGTYKLCVGRSRALDDTFMDRKGVRMTEGGGELLLSTISGTDFSGAGHNGEIFIDSNGRTYMFIHSQWKGCVRQDMKWPNGPRCVSLQEVHWDKEGWPHFETGALLKQERKPDFKLIASEGSPRGKL